MDCGLARRQTGTYSTVLTNDKRSEKGPESQTKPETVFQQRGLRRGSLLATSGQRRKHKAGQDVMTGTRGSEAGARRGRAGTEEAGLTLRSPCGQDPGSISRWPSILTSKWWTGEYLQGTTNPKG